MKKNLISVLYLFLSTLTFSQNTVEFTVGGGGTIVDIEDLVEKDESSGSFASDWGTMNYGISGQYFFQTKEKLSFGAELMFHEFYWYNVTVNYGDQKIYRDYTVTSIKMSPILRYSLKENVSLDIGPTINIMDDLIFGLFMSGNYYIPFSEKIDFPVKFRIDVLKNVVITSPISLNAGIRIKI